MSPGPGEVPASNTPPPAEVAQKQQKEKEAAQKAQAVETVPVPQNAEGMGKAVESLRAPRMKASNDLVARNTAELSRGLQQLNTQLKGLAEDFNGGSGLRSPAESAAAIQEGRKILQEYGRNPEAPYAYERSVSRLRAAGVAVPAGGIEGLNKAAADGGRDLRSAGGSLYQLRGNFELMLLTFREGMDPAGNRSTLAAARAEEIGRKKAEAQAVLLPGQTEVKETEAVLKGTLPDYLRKNLTDSVARLRTVLGSSTPQTETLQKMTKEVHALRTAVPQLIQAYEAAGKVITEAQARLSSTTNAPAGTVRDNINKQIAALEKMRIENNPEATTKQTEALRKLLT